MTNSISILQRNRPEISLVVILGILLILSVNRTHDWGGDFAQYLDNTRDLVIGSNELTHEVLDGINFAPATRGAGFSLLLAPIYLIFGDDILHFTIYISSIFLLCVVVLFKFNRKSGLSTPIAWLLTLAFALHPDVIALKFEILPTFPFLALLYLFFQNDQIKSNKQLALVTLLVGTLISFRNVGWSVYLVALIHFSVSWIKSKNRTNLVHVIGFALAVPLIDMFIKWVVFGSTTTENLSWYGTAFHVEDWQTLGNRLLYYYDQLLSFFKVAVLGIIGLTIGKVMILLTLLGWGYTLFQKKWSMADSFIVCYSLILIFYEGVSGIRFMIPILPLLLLYWANGLALILVKVREVLSNRIQLATIITILVLFLPGIWALILKAKTSIPGPNTPASQEAFTYIQNNLSTHEATAFHKPWVFHYYTGRTSMAINPKNGKEGLSMDYLVNKMTRFKVAYILVSINPNDVAIYNHKLVIDLQEDSRFTERWRNDAFAFLSFKGDNRNKKSAL